MKVLQLSVVMLALLVATAVAQDGGDDGPYDVDEREGDDDSSNYDRRRDVGGADDGNNEDEEEDFDPNNPPEGVTCENGVCTRTEIVKTALERPEAKNKGWFRRVRIRVRRFVRKFFYHAIRRVVWPVGR